MNRQDIKTMIARLTNLTLSDHSDEEYDNSIIQSVINMIEELDNLVNKLQEEKATQKSYYEIVFNDGANRIKSLMEDNTKLKEEILQLEAIIDD